MKLSDLESAHRIIVDEMLPSVLQFAVEACDLFDSGDPDPEDAARFRDRWSGTLQQMTQRAGNLLSGWNDFICATRDWQTVSIATIGQPTDRTTARHWHWMPIEIAVRQWQWLSHCSPEVPFPVADPDALRPELENELSRARWVWLRENNHSAESDSKNPTVRQAVNGSPQNPDVLHLVFEFQRRAAEIKAGTVKKVDIARKLLEPGYPGVPHHELTRKANNLIDQARRFM